MQKYKTREEWLHAGFRSLTNLFPEGDRPRLPTAVCVIISWPFRTKKAKGECYTKACTKDGSTYITISPKLETGLEALGILIHEMVHALGIHNHGKDFRKYMKILGLIGNARCSEPGEELTKTLSEIAKDLGDLPHVSLHPEEKGGPKEEDPNKRKNPVKVVSPADPNYVVYISIQRYDKFGPPVCPISGQKMIDPDSKG